VFSPSFSKEFFAMSQQLSAAKQGKERLIRLIVVVLLTPISVGLLKNSNFRISEQVTGKEIKFTPA
jgi:hypothetical protein